MEWISLCVWLIISVLAWYDLKSAMVCYVALKLFLIKPILLVFISNFPLITLDRGLLMSLIVVSFIQHPSWFLNREILKHTPFIYAWFFLGFTYSVLLIARFHTPMEGIKALSNFLLENFLVYIIFMNSSTQISDFRKLFRVGIGALSVVVLYGIITKIVGANPFIEYFSAQARAFGNDALVFTYGQETRFGISDRIQSVLFHPIAYAGILALFFPVVCIAYLCETDRGKKLYLLVLSAFILVSLFFTNSRSGLLSGLIGAISIVFGLAYTRKSKQNRWVVGAVALLFTLLLVFNVNGIGTHLRSTLMFWENSTNSMGSTLAERAEKFRHAFELTKEHPWFGYGYGFVAEQIKANNAQIGGAESFWILCMLEFGIVGLLGYASFFIGIFVGVLKNVFSENGFVRLLYITMLCTIMGYLVFISATGMLDTFAIFSLFFALFSAYIHFKKNETRNIQGLHVYKS